MTDRTSRRAMIGRLTWLAMLLILALPLAPASAHYIDLKGKLVQDGSLTVGVALAGRPFAYRQDGTVKGFEVAFAGAVARSRGLDLKVVQLPRGRLLDALAAGEVDLITTLALEDPAPDGIDRLDYLVVGDHMMILKGNPFRIQEPADLAGQTVAATAGTTAETFAREIDRRLTDQGLRPMDIHTFPFQRDTHFPVSMGHAAAYFVKSVSAVLPSLDPESRVRLVEGVFRPVGEVGYGLRRGEQDLRDAVLHAIAAQVASGTYERLRREFGLPLDLSPYRD
jgi:polar amino acid transport system substrate-binding protein